METHGWKVADAKKLAGGRITQALLEIHDGMCRAKLTIEGRSHRRSVLLAFTAPTVAEARQLGHEACAALFACHALAERPDGAPGMDAETYGVQPGHVTDAERVRWCSVRVEGADAAMWLADFFGDAYLEEVEPLLGCP